MTDNEELKSKVDNAITGVNEQHRAPASGNFITRTFSGIRHLFSGITTSLATWLHKKGIIADKSQGDSLIPVSFGAIAGLGSGLLTNSLTGKWFRDMPIIGGLLSTAVGGIIGLFTHQAMSPVTTGLTDQHLTVGKNTVTPLPRKKVIRDRTIDVPAPNKDGKSMPPSTRLVPEAMMENLRSPTTGWRQIMQLRAEVDDASTTELGIGTVKPATKDQIVLSKARDGVARLQLSYQNWEETMWKLNGYSDNYRNVVRPQITNQMLDIGLDRYESKLAVPQFPTIPTLQAPAEWNGWKGANGLTGGLDAQVSRAMLFLKKHVSGMGHLNEQDWSKLNTSEKLNVLRRYRAEVSELAFTKLNGEKVSDSYIILNNLNWSEKAQYLDLGFAKAAFTDSGAAVANLQAWMKTHNTETLGKRDWTPKEWHEFGHLITMVASDNPFKDKASLNKAKQLAEYCQFRSGLCDEMNRFDREVHQPNRELLEAYAGKGGQLDQYNKKVETFAQQMEVLERNRVMVSMNGLYMEVIDIRNQPPRRYKIKHQEGVYKVYAEHSDQPVHIPEAEIAIDPLKQETEKGMLAAAIPIVDKAERLVLKDRANAGIHWVRSTYHVNADGSDPNAYTKYENRIDMEQGPARDAASKRNYDQVEDARKAGKPEKEVEELRTKLSKAFDDVWNKPKQDYLCDNIVHDMFYVLDNRGNANRNVVIRERVDKRSDGCEVSINGGSWIKVTYDERDHGLDTTGGRINATTRIIDEADRIIAVASKSKITILEHGQNKDDYYLTYRDESTAKPEVITAYFVRQPNSTYQITHAWKGNYDVNSKRDESKLAASIEIERSVVDALNQPKLPINTEKLAETLRKINVTAIVQEQSTRQANPMRTLVANLPVGPNLFPVMHQEDLPGSSPAATTVTLASSARKQNAINES